MFSHKSLIRLHIKAKALVNTEGFPNDVRNPIQHLTKAKHFQHYFRLGVVLAFGEKAKMNPDPHIAKDQGHAHVIVHMPGRSEGDG